MKLVTYLILISNTTLRGVSEYEVSYLKVLGM